MRLSRMFGKTLRSEPAEAESISHRLMLKAGMVHQVSAGVYSYMPLAWRVLRNIENIIREEMNAAGGQEVKMPVIQPLELWETTGRASAFGDALFKLKDRRDRPLCLAPTHEEVITQMAIQHIHSYKDMPQMPYQIQTKLRDEPRPRAGLMRVREFDMKDLYSMDVDQDALDVSYEKMVQAYKNIYRRCGLPAIAVEADSGAIGGKDSHEFILIADSGEDQIVQCAGCGFAANLERASGVKSPQPKTGPLPLEEVATPGIKTIKGLADFVGVPESKTLKAVFYSADGETVFIVIRGDLEVNDVKLKNLLHAADLRLATEEEVKAAGLVAGSASPVGRGDLKCIADDSIELGDNFVVGANKPDTHLLNANYPRDFRADTITDIAEVQVGQGCPQCGEALSITRGIEVGHVFKLGTFFSEALGAYYSDREGHQKPIVMGCYGIGVGRLMAAAMEQNHDEHGIVWPIPIAPYQVHLCALSLDRPGVADAADQLYESLEAAGLEVLYDDRDDSPGVKFNDADLLGIPVRLTVSPRNLKQDAVEITDRTTLEKRMAPMSDAVPEAKAMLGV